MRISDWSSDVCSSDLATAKTLQAFHDRWYRPENVVISIAGDGDPKLFEQYVRKYFADWKGKGKTHPVPDFGKPDGRSEERRAGKEWGRTCRSRRTTYNS